MEQRRAATPSLSPRHRTTQAAPTRRRRARQAELEREVADLRSKVANPTETLDKVVGVLASQGLGLGGTCRPRAALRPQDWSFFPSGCLRKRPAARLAPHSLDGLATSPRLADAGPRASCCGASARGGAGPGRVDAGAAGAEPEGRPLGRLPSGDIALNSFEARAESPIRTPSRRSGRRLSKSLGCLALLLAAAAAARRGNPLDLSRPQSLPTTLAAGRRGSTPCVVVRGILRRRDGLRVSRIGMILPGAAASLQSLSWPAFQCCSWQAGSRPRSSASCSGCIAAEVGGRGPAAGAFKWAMVVWRRFGSPKETFRRFCLSSD